jgi:hypothetical protein
MAAAPPQAPPQALDINAWIRLADERGLIATIDDFAALPENVPVRLAPLEYSRFRLGDRAPIHPEPAPGCQLPPDEFFAPLSWMFRRTADMCLKPLWFHTPDGPQESMKPMVVGDLVFDDGNLCNDAGIVAVGDNREASSGSGDGYSRYVMWPRLESAGMPLVFHTYHASE